MKKNTRIEIPVMFCFDRNYVIPGAVTFLSILTLVNKNELEIEQEGNFEKIYLKGK